MLAFLITLAYVGLVYIRPQEYMPMLAEVPVLPVVLAGAVAAWLPLGGKRFDAPQNWLLPVLVAFMALTVAANGWLGGAWVTLGKFLPLVALFYLIAGTTSTVARHRALMVAIALFTIVLAVHGIDQSGNEEGVGWSGARVVEGGRITYIGIFNDPNDLALSFVMALPLLAHCFRSTDSTLAKAFWLCGIATLLYGIFLTNSRGGMLAAFALVAIQAYRRFGIPGILALCTAGVALLLSLPTRLATEKAVDESAAGRVDAWYAGIQLLLRHPLFGVGQGNFTDHNGLTAHNSLVLAFAELGFAGYFLWLAFVGISFYMVWRITRTGTPPDDPAGLPPAVKAPASRADWARHQDIAATYLSSMLGFFIAAFFLSRSYNILLVMFCGLSVALYQCTRRDWPGFPPITFRATALPIAVFEAASIAGLFVLVKVLL